MVSATGMSPAIEWRTLMTNAVAIFAAKSRDDKPWLQHLVLTNSQNEIVQQNIGILCRFPIGPLLVISGSYLVGRGGVTV